jgi:hypothetical protein
MKLRERCIKLVKKNGLKGGILIFHPFRKKHMDGSECDEYQCPYLHKWVEGPHFHVLGYGKLIESDRFYSDSGWVYKNMGYRRSISWTVKYLLTHCGLGYYDEDRRFHTVTWFGLISYNKVVIEREKIEYKKVPCPECEKPLHEYLGYSGEGEIKLEQLTDNGVFEERVRIKVWCLSKNRQTKEVGLYKGYKKSNA